MARTVTLKTAAKTEAPKGSSSCCGSAERAEIEKMAYKFFLDRGGVHGYHQQDWAKAEAVVKSRKKS